MTTGARQESPVVAPPRVDVIVNNFNYAPYLRAAIDSALAQTHPGTRVIVVDDGSTDESPAIIRSYGDRIRAVFKANGGQASAMNAGIESAEGDVIIFLDADDTLEPQATQEVADAFAREPGLARVHYRLGVVDSEGRGTGETKPPGRLGLAHGDLTTATLRTPFDAAWLPTSGNAFAAWALRRISPIPEDQYRLCADWYIVHVSSLLGPVAAIDAPLARYRMHGANGFSRPGGDLDLPHLGETVGYARITRDHIHRIARQEGIPHDARLTASMCDVANRAVLLREGAATAGPRDSRRGLLRLGARACSGRSDVGIVMKAMFLAWLVAMLTVPRRAARWLGEVFLVPERRRRLNALLGALHRS